MYVSIYFTLGKYHHQQHHQLALTLYIMMTLKFNIFRKIKCMYLCMFGSFTEPIDWLE